MKVVVAGVEGVDAALGDAVPDLEVVRLDPADPSALAEALAAATLAVLSRGAWETVTGAGITVTVPVICCIDPATPPIELRRLTEAGVQRLRTGRQFGGLGGIAELCVRLRVDEDQLLVADDGHEVAGRLGLEVIVQHDPVVLRDDRLCRAQPGDVDGIAREGAGDLRTAGRQRLEVGRDQVGRLMETGGLAGAVRGRHSTVTTRADRSAPRHPDLVQRGWDVPTAPSRLKKAGRVQAKAAPALAASRNQDCR